MKANKIDTPKTLEDHVALLRKRLGPSAEIQKSPTTGEFVVTVADPTDFVGIRVVGRGRTLSAAIGSVRA